MGETRQAAGLSLSTHVLQGALSQAQAFPGCRDSGETAPHVTAVIVPGRCGRKGDAS